jgi:hypothetical protein
MVFKLHMFELYKELTNEQTEPTRPFVSNPPMPQEKRIFKKVLLVCPSLTAVLNPSSTGLNLKILTEVVMKYMGITETTDMLASGWSMNDHKMACLELYKQRYGTPMCCHT